MLRHYWNARGYMYKKYIIPKLRLDVFYANKDKSSVLETIVCSNTFSRLSYPLYIPFET